MIIKGSRFFTHQVYGTNDYSLENRTGAARSHCVLQESEGALQTSKDILALTFAMF